MRASDSFDAIVIGSGAGGSAAAYRLVSAGLRVALVEKGRRLPQDGSTLDVQKVIRDGAFKSRERWVTRIGHELVPEEYCNLGGKTKWYGAALARFGAAEFHAVPEHGYLAWPLSRSDLDPYYDEIEALLGVRRFPCEPDLAALIERLARGGSEWRAEPLPLGLGAAITDDRHEAAHFDGFASAGGLKSDGETAVLARIARSPDLTLLTGRAAVALLGEARDPERIRGVRLADGTELHARAVVLAMGAMHSPRLLQRYLRAANLLHLPLADVAGRNFKLHHLTAVLAISRSRKTDLLRKTTLLLNERFPHSSVQPLGFDGELITALMPGYVPRRVARELGARAYGFFLQTEDGSSPANRVVDASLAAGRPLLDYDAGRVAAPLAEHRALVAGLCRDLRRAGYLAFGQPIGLHGTAHACGTLVAGADPAAAAVDAGGKAYGLENLYIVDGSVLPRSSRVNPALTIYAWSLRVAEGLARQLLGVAQAAPAPRALPSVA